MTEQTNSRWYDFIVSKKENRFNEFARITVVEIEGCEYIMTESRFVLHKQNCRFCEERKNGKP